MESKKVTLLCGDHQEDKKNVKLIEWEDYEQELARLCSLTSALNEAKQKKQLVQEKLQSLIQVEAESLSRLNELDKMKEKLDSRKLVMGNMSMQSKVVKEKVKKQEEQLSNDIRSLLVAGTSLSAASKRLQDASRSLAGERGYGHLRTLQRVFRTRQQYMVSQVQLLYPVRVAIGQAPEQELESFNNILHSASSSPEAAPRIAPRGSRFVSSTHSPEKISSSVPRSLMAMFADNDELQELIPVA